MSTQRRHTVPLTSTPTGETTPTTPPSQQSRLFKGKKKEIRQILFRQTRRLKNRKMTKLFQLEFQ